MSEFHLIVIEFLLLLALFFFIFAFSIISAEFIVVFISIVLFFIFLIPFFHVLNEISLVGFNEGFEATLFNSIISYSKFIIIFIGIFLIIELVYISFFS
jgi:hypothetical protein